jgi:hypothetical protein
MRCGHRVRVCTARRSAAVRKRQWIGQPACAMSPLSCVRLCMALRFFTRFLDGVRSQTPNGSKLGAEASVSVRTAGSYDGRSGLHSLRWHEIWFASASLDSRGCARRQTSVPSEGRPPVSEGPPSAERGASVIPACYLHVEACVSFQVVCLLARP